MPQGNELLTPCPEFLFFSLVLLVGPLHGRMEEHCVINFVSVNVVEDYSALPLSSLHDDLDVTPTSCQVRGVACAERLPADALGVEAHR